MSASSTDTEIDLDSQVDFSADVQCIGVSYLNLVTGEEHPGLCPDPAKWTRHPHCTTRRKDMYCDRCRLRLEDLAQMGCVRCSTCIAVVSPDELRWYPL